jgi:hypothetical protein
VTNSNLTAAQQKIINDAMSAIDQTVSLLSLISEHLISDSTTDALGTAIEGVETIARRAQTLGELVA